MIVDDEKQTRQGLSQWNGWHDLSVEVVACAENGKTALSMINQVLPDLILCDIRMPEMDGLTFVEQIKAKHFPVKVIFISGYDDTAYLKKAIKLSAFDYLMKPIDLDELRQCVENLIHEIENDKGREPYLSRALEVYEKGNKDLHHLIVENAIYSDDSAEHLDLVRKNVDDLPASGRMVAVFAYHENSALRNQFILDLLNSVPEISYAYHLPHNDNIYCGLMSCDCRSAEEIGGDIISAFKAHQYNPCIVSISSFFTDFSMIHGALEEALSISEKILYSNTYSVVIYSPEATNTADPHNPISIGDVKHSISMEDRSSFESWLGEETDRLISAKVTDRDACIKYYGSILHAVFAYLPESFQSDETLELNESEAILALSKMFSLEQLKEHILKYYTIIYDILHMDSNGYASHSVRLACKYIDEHLSDEITVQQLGSIVNISPTYLCALFKHETGCTIGSYIRVHRLEYAAKLLKNSSLKLYDVAYEAGYPNPSHFSKLFKKLYGCTPSEYRDRN